MSRILYHDEHVLTDLSNLPDYVLEQKLQGLNVGGTGEANTISSLTSGGTSLLATPSKVGVDLQTKGLKVGAGLSIGSSGTDITISSTTAGGLDYVGAWNANTNTPTLVSSVGVKNNYYIVSVAGTTTLDTINEWDVNDWVVFNGAVWQKIDNSQSLTNYNALTDTELTGLSDNQLAQYDLTALKWKNVSEPYQYRESGRFKIIKTSTGDPNDVLIDSLTVWSYEYSATQKATGTGSSFWNDPTYTKPVSTFGYSATTDPKYFNGNDISAGKQAYLYIYCDFNFVKTNVFFARFLYMSPNIHMYINGNAVSPPDASYDAEGTVRDLNIPYNLADPVLVNGSNRIAVELHDDGAGAAIYWASALSVGRMVPINSITDVTTTTPTDNQLLKYSGGQWINSTVSSQDIPASSLTGSTYNTVQHMQDIFHSTGWVSGGDFTDNANGTIAVSAGEGLIRATDNILDVLYFTSFPQNLAVSLTDNTLNYIYVFYNAGSPNVNPYTSKQNHNQYIFLGTVYRAGTTLTLDQSTRPKVANHASNMIQRGIDLAPFARILNGGALITASGTLGFAISQGTFWSGLTKFTTAAYDSPTTTFKYYYQNGTGGWTVSNANAIDAVNYDDGSGTLAPLANNRYGVHWVYLLKDGSVSVLYGRDSYNDVNAAQSASIITTLPPEMIPVSTLNGRIIIKKNAVAFERIDSVYNGNLPQTLDLSALNISYINTTSGLTATNVQDALDEIEARVDTNDTKISAGGSINTHSDVTITAPVQDNTLRYDNGTGQWVNYTMTTSSAGGTTLVKSNNFDTVLYGLSAPNAYESSLTVNTNDIRVNVPRLDTNNKVKIDTAGNWALVASGANLNVEGFIANIAILSSANGVAHNLSINNAGMVLPSGTTAQQEVAPIVGTLRYNTTDSKAEIYDGAWTQLGGGGGGGTKTTIYTNNKWCQTAYTGSTSVVIQGNGNDLLRSNYAGNYLPFQGIYGGNPNIILGTTGGVRGVLLSGNSNTYACDNNDYFQINEAGLFHITVNIAVHGYNDITIYPTFFICALLCLRGSDLFICNENATGETTNNIHTVQSGLNVCQFHCEDKHAQYATHKSSLASFSFNVPYNVTSGDKFSISLAHGRGSFAGHYGPYACVFDTKIDIEKIA